MSFIITILVMVLSTLFGAVGSVLFKLVLNKSKNFSKIFSDFTLYLGIFLFGLGFIVYLFLLRQNDVTYLFPITSLTYVWTSIFSVVLLNEKMNRRKLIGISLIVIGIISLAII